MSELHRNRSGADVTRVDLLRLPARRAGGGLLASPYLVAALVVPVVVLVGYLAFQGFIALREHAVASLVADVKALPAPAGLTSDPLLSHCHSRGTACFTTSLPPVDAAAAVKDALERRGISTGAVACPAGDAALQDLSIDAECMSGHEQFDHVLLIETSAHALNSVGQTKTVLGYTWVRLSVLSRYDEDPEPITAQGTAADIEGWRKKLVPQQWNVTGSCTESNGVCTDYEGDAAIPAEVTLETAQATMLDHVRRAGLVLEDTGCTPLAGGPLKCLVVAHGQDKSMGSVEFLAFIRADKEAHRMRFILSSK